MKEWEREAALPFISLVLILFLPFFNQFFFHFCGFSTSWSRRRACHWCWSWQLCLCWQCQWLASRPSSHSKRAMGTTQCGLFLQLWTSTQPLKFGVHFLSLSLDPYSQVFFYHIISVRMFFNHFKAGFISVASVFRYEYYPHSYLLVASFDLICFPVFTDVCVFDLTYFPLLTDVCVVRSLFFFHTLLPDVLLNWFHYVFTIPS